MQREASWAKFRRNRIGGLRLPGGLSLLLVLLLAPMLAEAQTPTVDDPFPTIREARRWGPFFVYRTFSIDNIGYDNNVFLVSEEDDRPKETDFVVRMGPEIQAQLLIGSRMALTLRDKLTGEFWAEFTELNSFSNDFEGQYDILLGRILLTTKGRWNTSFGRPSSEFDDRTRRKRTDLEQRAIWFITPKTDLQVSATVARTRYSDEESRFLIDPDGDGTGQRVTIETALNRDSNEVAAELGWRPRNRTRFLVGYSFEDQDFVSDEAGRDAEEMRVYVGAEFRPSAYISGRIEVGRSELDSSEDRFEYEPYEGTFSDTNLVYRPTGSTRVSLGYSQEARFSTYDRNLYYEYTQREIAIETFPGNWLGFQLGASRRDLDYPEPNSVSAPIGERRADTIDDYYGGLLFRLPRGLQMGIRVGRRDRDSNVRFARDEQTYLQTTGSFRF
jgi:hypothetical protein